MDIVSECGSVVVFVVTAGGKVAGEPFVMSAFSDGGVGIDSFAVIDNVGACAGIGDIFACVA